MKPSDLSADIELMGWSQAQFADKIGVHPNTVSKWTTGKTEIPGPVSAFMTLATTLKRMLLNLTT